MKKILINNYLYFLINIKLLFEQLIITIDNHQL